MTATVTALPVLGSLAAGIAAVAVSLIHGCALQSVIDPKGFDVEQHFDAAAHMLDQLASAHLAQPARAIESM